MEKKLLIIFMIFALVSCQSKEKKLIGHWHEFKTNNSEYLNCYHITDSTFEINALTNMRYVYNRKELDIEKSEISSLAIENHGWTSDFKINGNKLTLNDSIFWVRQINNRKSFISDFSAGLLVNINPPETNNSEFDFISNDETFGNYILVGKLKNDVLSRFKHFDKDQYYIQLNDKIGKLEDIIPFLNCNHCDISKQIVLMNVDRNTPRKLLAEIESEMFSIYIKKNQIYYLKIDANELISGYNHSY
ncbi:hypothetical protein ES692_07040 [Psychroserpens burtonensis]|uniref:Lipoprotein n=1 Tax=Psychroserpens burtonensis TaxID=49278 RepID=A0A5C7B9V2_9FLAO|nr:hypothetical protein [Psychroserpens burtonensis]TXE18395.1 hypothetical protein ES692_07040 [Psychroserpens burtonensis]